MKCKHDERLPLVWFSLLPPDARIRVCYDCYEWLSLGPSNDDPYEVQQEITAAEWAGSPQIMRRLRRIHKDHAHKEP